MGNNLLWSVALFFIQPIFWVGMVMTFVNYRRRVNYTRNNFRVNFVRENFELKDYLLKGLLPGLVLSLLSVGVGMPLTLEWYLVYQVLAIVLLMIGGYRFIHPLFTFTLTSLVLYALDFLNIALPFERLNRFVSQSFYTFEIASIDFSTLTLNVLLLMLFILLATVHQMKKQDSHKIFPILRTSKRGKTVAKYQKKSLWVLPLMVVVPGEVFQGLADWWPLLDINGQQYAFLFVPILVGYHFTVSTQLVEEATSNVQMDYRNLAFFGIGLAILSYFIPDLTIWATFLMFILGLVILIRHRRRENQWSFRYGPTGEGLRIIAVRSDSPAERMNLSIGDTILEINEYAMIDEKTYNKVLAYNRSYIKMRIRRRDGEIIIVETPLYDNDYNNLGLLLLDN